jgi:RHS repeat-associated protein
MYSVGASLWRVPIPHFTVFDLNWGPLPPPGAGGPTGGPPAGPGSGPGGCQTTMMSTIECQRQSLGEDLPLAGTPYALHYESDRQRGRKASLLIPLSADTLPGPVSSITMEVTVAGRVFDQTFPPQTNQTTTFTWDGMDAFGRLLQGDQPIRVQIGDTYQGTYSAEQFFDVSNAVTLSAGMRQDVVLSSTWNGTIHGWDAEPQGLGGWDLSVHHSFDIPGQMLRFGDGSELTPADLPGIIGTFAGSGATDFAPGSTLGGGGPATLATLAGPQSVAIGPDGRVYIVDGECIRVVGTDGIIQTFAGQCLNAGFSGDEGPATAALLYTPEDIAFGPDGSLYVADAYNNRIRRIDPSGIIHTVAGSGPLGASAGGFSGDGGSGLQATLNLPWGVDVTPDGTLFIADFGNERIRRITPDGVITAAGIGTGGCYSQDTKGYGAAATAAHLCGVLRVRVANDGGFYLTEFNANQVDRVGKDGIITAFAGNSNFGYGGDGGQATAAILRSPMDIAIGLDGSVYVLDQNFTVRQVAPSGLISTVLGIAGNSNFGGDGGFAGQATMGVSAGVRVGPDGSLYLADTADDRVRRTQLVFSGLAIGTGNYQFASRDGSQLFVFDPTGRHLQTLDAYTGAALYTFGYDSAGRLASVTDVDNDMTRFNHDESGNLASVVGPFGSQTSFTPDANGYLATATDPANETTAFTYDANGLMQTKINPRGALGQYSYDSFGRLQEDQDAAGGSRTLSRTDSGSSFTVTSTTALGRQTSYQTTNPSASAIGRLNTLPSGLQSSLQFSPNSGTTTTVPDGTTTSEIDAPDPRFGMLSPLATVTTTTPSGLSSTQATMRTVTLSGSVLATLTEQTNLNGNTWTRLFDANGLTWTTTSPVGRTTATTIDTAGRPTQIALPNIAPFAFAYDSHGRLTATTQGARTWTQGYDAQGYLSSVTDPLSHAIGYTNDPVGRPTQTQLPDGRKLGVAYDGDSNTTSITLPSTELHQFSYTPVDLTSSYTPPSLGSSSPSTQYTYDVDRELTMVTRPDSATIAYGYDAAGRLVTTTYPQGTLTFAYNATTGQLVSRTAASGEGLQYAYDGFLRTGVTWSGPVVGTLTLSFDNNFRMTSQTVNGTALSFTYDADGLLTSAGALRLTLDSQNGRLNGTTLGSMTDTYTYDSNGLFASYTANYNGSSLYSESVVRDATGRITQKTETVQGNTHVWGYTFDATGRLTDVTEDSSFFAHYAYDADDNRTTYTNTSGTVNPTYDAQDRLVTYGSASYGYTLNGELTSKTIGSQTTSYTYDVLGNLLHVGPPTGSAIDYVTDGESRRVGKKVASTLTTGFVYQDALNVVAQLDGSGNLVGRYVFGSKPNVPDYFTTSSGTFRIFSDHLGSPRLIVNTSSGAIVEQIDYDEFGVVTSDTSPGLTPFGFAGGLYDKDTALVRFGARDYDASVGRWTSKDPIQFNGGSFNLYEYGQNDPIDEIDGDGMGLRACASALGQLAAAVAVVGKRTEENLVCPDPGHDKSIEQAKNRLRKAYNSVQNVCTAKDIAAIAGAAGTIAAAAAFLYLVPVFIPAVAVSGH